MAAGDDVFGAVLVTRGRRTGRIHSVRLKAVLHSGKIYFSRHRPDADWYCNAAANPDVVVRRGETSSAGTARVVTDDSLLHLVSELKYPGEARARERRVAIEVSLREDVVQ